MFYKKYYNIEFNEKNNFNIWFLHLGHRKYVNTICISIKVIYSKNHIYLILQISYARNYASDNYFKYFERIIRHLNCRKKGNLP